MWAIKFTLPGQWLKKRIVIRVDWQLQRLEAVVLVAKTNRKSQEGL